MKAKILLAGTLVCAGIAAAGFFFVGKNGAPCRAAAPAAATRVPAGTEFPVRLGEKKLSLRMALTDLERRRGLTGCRGLPENSGMLFVYADAARRSFWMRGVPVGLSIGFFDAAGTLLESREMLAHDTSSTVSRSANVKFALEMRAGWFTENGAAAGTRLALEDVAAAVEARGFSAEKFRLDAAED